MIKILRREFFYIFSFSLYTWLALTTPSYKIVCTDIVYTLLNTLAMYAVMIANCSCYRKQFYFLAQKDYY